MQIRTKSISSIAARDHSADSGSILHIPHDGSIAPDINMFILPKMPLFGKTLKIDIAPPHFCPFNCTYCPRSTQINQKIDRFGIHREGAVLRCLPEILAAAPQTEHIVLGGSGEPTLFAGLAQLIRDIKKISQIPVVVESCGSLLWRSDVRQDIASANIVTATLDAADKTVYQCVNRPQMQIPFARFVNGLIDFSRGYKGKLWLVVHLLDGITAIQGEVIKLAEIVAQIRPDRVLLKTTPHPRIDPIGQPVSGERMLEFLSMFKTHNGSVVTETQEDTK